MNYVILRQFLNSNTSLLGTFSKCRLLGKCTDILDEIGINASINNWQWHYDASTGSCYIVISCYYRVGFGSAESIFIIKTTSNNTLVLEFTVTKNKKQDDIVLFTIKPSETWGNLTLNMSCNDIVCFNLSSTLGGFMYELEIRRNNTLDLTNKRKLKSMFKDIMTVFKM